jgi:hypothetical protein
MAFDSEPDEASRKTLDDIRRELEAEYGFVEVPEPAAAAPREVVRDRRAAPPVANRRIVQDRMPREESDEDTADARLAHFQAIFDRHHAAMERRRPLSERRARRSGYLIAGLVGCAAGQIVVLAFLTVTRHGGAPDVSLTRAPVSSGLEVATAVAPYQPERTDSQFSPETRSETESAAVPSTASPWSFVELPPRIAQLEPRASASREPAAVSAPTARDSVQPPVASEPRRAPARPLGGAGTHNVAESQARLRTALGEWLRTSARGGATVQTTEPVIVFGPDGRTAKTYVSVASPIGFIPRQQQWELGPRGWSLVDDRQAGLPRPR